MSSLVVNIAIITNPFDPEHNIIRDQLAWVEGKSLKEYLGDLEGKFMATLNGGIVEEEDWSTTFPFHGDFIAVSAIPYGGDGGVKTALRLVAAVALTVVSGPAGAAAFGAGTTAAAVASAAIVVGGTMLINAVLPPPTPDVGDDKDISDSPTYGTSGAQNTSESGIPIPLVYGNYRVAGNVVGSYVENINDEQFLYMLYNAGEGEVDSISDIIVNDQPIANFSEITLETRLGTAGQSSIGWFDLVRRPFNVGSTIVSDVWRQYTFRDRSDRSSLEIVFPSGLFGINSKNGKKYSVSVSLEIQYRAYIAGQGEEEGWIPFPWLADDGSQRRALYTITANQSSVLRRTIKSDDLGIDEYFEVRIKRTSETDSDYINDECQLGTVTEISTENVTYKHTALVGLRILMTEQINNRPNVTYLHGGIKVKTWEEYGEDYTIKSSSNPAWIAYDVLTNDRYGAGIPESYINLERFVEWAKWCDDQRLEFNGVLDTSSNAFDILEPVFRIGHAKIFTTGTRISVTIEKPDNPVMMFSQANMIKDTFVISWLPTNDRANEVEVTYNDKDFDYQQKVVKVYDDTILNNNEIQRPSSFTLLGCTSEEQAYYEGLLAINYNKYIQQSITFDASIDAIACTIGSVVYIQHDMPQWGYSGRLLDADQSPHYINIDIDPNEMEGAPDLVLVHHSVLSHGTGSVTGYYLDALQVNFNPGTEDISRIRVHGIDYKVNRVVLSSDHCDVYVDEGVPGSVGDEVELLQTDVYEEREIQQFEGSKVQLSSPLSFTPDRFAQYLIGERNTVKKKFRITGIDYQSDHTRTISAIEYNESVYDRDIPFAPSPVQPGIGLLEHTEISGIEEELIQIGKNLRPRVTINYRNQSSQYQTTQVYVSSNNGPYTIIGTNRRSVTFESEDRVELKIKLVAVSASGVAKAIDSVEAVEYTVLGKTAPPEDVQNFVITKEVGGINLSWDAVSDLDIEGYEIRSGTSWSDGEVIAPALNATVLFIPISEPGTYQYMVRAVDTSGNLSENATLSEIGLIRPQRVFNFAAVQHVDKIVMQWDRPADRNITSFWIREGSTWANSYIHGSVTGTTFELPAGVSSSTEPDSQGRTFWIKSVDIIGIESEEAVFASTAVVDLPNRNLVKSFLHGVDDRGIWQGAPGIRLNVETATNEIKMINGVNFAEYTMEIDLPYSARARNVSGFKVGVQVENPDTWDDATYTWDSPFAESAWAGQGDPENVEFKGYLSQKQTGPVSFFDGTTYLFSLNRTLQCDVTGINPYTASHFDYAPARYNQGIRVNPLTDVRWNVTVPDEWTVGSWVLMPSSVTGDLNGVGGSIQLNNGKFVYLYISATTGSLVAREDNAPDIVIDNFRPQPGDAVYVAISQSNGERVMRARNLSEPATRKASVEYTPVTHPTRVALGFVAS